MLVVLYTVQSPRRPHGYIKNSDGGDSGETFWNDNNNATCHNSTLTFTGTVADLEQLNGAVLTCFDGSSQTDNVTIVIRIPGENNF